MNECTHNAKPSPQVIGKQEQQENNCRLHLTNKEYYTEIIIILIIQCMCVFVTIYTPVLARVHNS